MTDPQDSDTTPPEPGDTPQDSGGTPPEEPRDPRLGRLPSPFDARDGMFPMTAALATLDPAQLPPYKYWTPGPILNQGSTPHCVGFGWAQFLQATPIRTAAGNVKGHAIYEVCKTIDGLPPGTDGTYVRTGVKVLQAEGHIAEYRWAQGLDDLRAWVLTRGPVVVGTNWYQAMFRPDLTSGLLSATGEIAGGHCYVLRGYSQARKQFRMVNSWGTSWGQGGQAWIDERTMWALISQSGEAVAAVEKRV